MDWRFRFASAALAYLLALVAFYPFLLFHFLQHHAEPWGTALVHASVGEHSIQSILFGFPFLVVGFVEHRRILGTQAGRAVVLPTFVGAGLGFLLVAFGPPQALAAGFLTALLAFVGALYMAPGRPTSAPPSAAHHARPF